MTDGLLAELETELDELGDEVDKLDEGVEGAVFKGGDATEKLEEMDPGSEAEADADGDDDAYRLLISKA